jgi:hypothetical protein
MTAVKKDRREKNPLWGKQNSLKRQKNRTENASKKSGNSVLKNRKAMWIGLARTG